MTFLVTVRWHPLGQETPCTAAWICHAIRGDAHHVILDDASGITVTIPLLQIENVLVERKG